MFNQLKLTQELKIIRLTNNYEFFKDPYHDLKQLVEECEDLYPGIDIWFNHKVKNGLRNRERTALVIYHDNKPIGASVLKIGNDAKICSMRILLEEQNKGIGSLMMALIAAEVRNKTMRIHFTIPQELWLEKHKFFEDYGFVNYGSTSVQYRLFDEELACNANFRDVWSTVIRRLPLTIENFTLNGSSPHYNLVLSVKPTYAQKIMLGTKRIEIRRKFSGKWKGTTALIYASKPRQEFIGEAIIGEVITGEPKSIWDNWGRDIGCTVEEYTQYCRGASEVYALVLNEVKPFRTPILLTQMEYLIQQDLTPPQSYCEVKRESVWPIALSLTCLLRGTP